MNFFEAKQANRIICQLKDLANKYWNAPDNDSKSLFREKVNKILPQATEVALKLGINTILSSAPPSNQGGIIIPVDMLEAIIRPEQGYCYQNQENVLDIINRIIEKAEHEQKKAFIRLVIPLYWIIDIPALIIRIPFIILKKSGLPPKIEENIIAHILKVLELLAIAYWATPLKTVLNSSN